MEINWKEIICFKWFKRLYFLYIFGFVVNLRLSVPFYYEYLISNNNFSENNVKEDILPVLFYSTSISLLPVYFLMEYSKFYPFIIISSLTGLVATCLFIWTDSWLEVQVAQVLFFKNFITKVGFSNFLVFSLSTDV